jgi:hypothetical protein
MTQTRFEPIQLDSDTTVTVEVADLGGQRQVTSELLNFDQVSGVIEKISRSLVEPVKKAAPKTATVEFGLAMALESGKLTALWVKGTGSANLKVKLKWENPGKSA